jgi:hypothetical protein
MINSGSNIIVSYFVPASEGTKVAMQIALPVLGVVFAAMLLSFMIPELMRRGKSKDLPYGAERKYGMGEGICPKCHRPFALSIFNLNLGFSKLTRCPYCGRWGTVRIQSLVKLRKAEQAELEWGKAEVQEESEEERLREQVDDSKYI